MHFLQRLIHSYSMSSACLVHFKAQPVILQEDKSLTRSHGYMQKLFAEAKMQLKFSSQQRNFPKELFAVHMYALQPRIQA